MTGTQLREWRHTLGLSQRQLAVLLGIHWNSLARKERGELPIPHPRWLEARMREIERDLFAEKHIPA